MDGQRIGILTFHRCINYGSYWQAHCLVEALRKRGHEPLVLDHRDACVDVAEWRVALRPTLPTAVTPRDQEEYACKVRKMRDKFDRLPRTEAFPLEDPRSLEPFDVVLVGSDEVWSQRHPWYANRGAFFGYGIPAQRISSYAASFGNHSCWEGIGSPWTDQLQKFEHISVRDENSWWMIKNALGIEPEIVLDPCLLNPPSVDASWKGPAGSFLLVYGHNFSDRFIRQVRAYAKAKQRPLLSIGYRNDWADHQWLTADQDDFALAAERCEGIATNFFHGCVFALAHTKPFVAEANSYRATKIENLLGMVGAGSHLTDERTSAKQVRARLEEPLSVVIEDRIEQLRVRSSAFLARAVSPEASRK